MWSEYPLQSTTCTDCTVVAHTDSELSRSCCICCRREWSDCISSPSFCLSCCESISAFEAFVRYSLLNIWMHEHLNWMQTNIRVIFRPKWCDAMWGADCRAEQRPSERSNQAIRFSNRIQYDTRKWMRSGRGEVAVAVRTYLKRCTSRAFSACSSTTRASSSRRFCASCSNSFMTLVAVAWDKQTGSTLNSATTRHWVCVRAVMAGIWCEDSLRLIVTARTTIWICIV